MAEQPESSYHLRMYLLPAIAAVASGALVLWKYPAIYGGDPIVRITNWERLQLAYQLPMIQVIVHLATRVTSDPIFLRVVLIAVAAAAACGMAALARVAFGPAPGVIAGLLFASNHFVIYLANSPYQEVLELGFLLWAMALIFGRGGRTGRAAGYVLLAAACLTRYEAWFAAAAVVLVRIVLERPQVNGALGFLLASAAGPFAWLAVNRGLSPAGTALLDPAFRAARLWRIPYVLGATLNHVASAVALAALLGLFLLYRSRNWRTQPVVLTLGLAGLLFLLALPFTSMGVLPDYDRYVTNREAHYLMPLLFLLASAGFMWLREHLSGTAVIAALLLIFAYEGYAAKRTLDQSLNEGNLQLDAALAQRLSAVLGPGDRAMILARPFPREGLDHFFDTIRRRQGETGVTEAKKMMAAMNIWTFDYSRIWVHAYRVRAQLVPAGPAAPDLASANIAVVFDDYAPVGAAEGTALLTALTAAVRSERYPPPSPGKAGAVIYWLPPRASSR